MPFLLQRGRVGRISRMLALGALVASGAIPATPADAGDDAPVAQEAIARPGAPAFFLNLAPVTAVGALSATSHAAVMAGAGLGLRVGDASGELALHVGTGRFARHYNAEVQGRYFSSPATYLIGLLQYGWVAPTADGRQYANATAFAGFGGMLAGSQHWYAELAIGAGNAWITDADGAEISVFEARAQVRIGWVFGRFAPRAQASWRPSLSRNSSPEASEYLSRGLDRSFGFGVTSGAHTGV